PAEGTADNGLPVLHMPDSPDAWHAWMQHKILPTEYPDATGHVVRSVAPVPELTAMLHQRLEPMRQQQAQQNAQNQAMGLAMSCYVDGGVLAFECGFEEGGRAWDLLLVLGVRVMGTDTQVGRQVRWAIEPNVSFCAPVGELEANMP